MKRTNPLRLSSVEGRGVTNKEVRQETLEAFLNY